ncbi:gamma-glutamyltransferase, partial [Mesobacillus sp. MER 48]|uniref:gamma-glutamyltransferase n=1 Tax=Mesobacillus sp. MER 48 TaxID=2939595 RepID=UPI00333F9214
MGDRPCRTRRRRLPRDSAPPFFRHRSRGGIRADDFASFRAGYEKGVIAEFRGHTVVKAGAWTQGPALLQALRILEPLADTRLDPATAEGAHTILETLKLALADRDAYFGDGADLSR